jgi:hypothetical protein
MGGPAKASSPPFNTARPGSRPTNDGAALGGGANFFAGGNMDPSAGSQTIDVLGAAAEIDAGRVTGTLSAYIGGFSTQEDAAQITATALAATGAGLGSVAIGPVTSAERGGVTALLPRTVSNAVPPGTRSIRIRMEMRRAQGTYNDGYVDNVSLTLAPTVVNPKPSPAPTPSPTPTPVPTPVPGKSVVGAPVSGKVLVKRPGGGGFVELDATQGIPLGSTIDTKAGVIELTANAGTKAKFYDGIFKVTQSGGTTDLALNEPLAPCGKARAAAKKPKTRKLWGDGSGSFRTRGQYSSATVRGTKWLVQDSCAGTLTRVMKGAVSVRDNVKHKTVVVRAGKRYLARRR